MSHPFRKNCGLLLLCALAAAAQPVEVVKVTARSAEKKIQLPGEFQPYQTVAIHARVAGFVDRVEVDRGSDVKQGQVLATLVAPELQARRMEAEARVQAVRAQRAEAEAKLAGVRSTYDRLKAASATPGAIAGNELVVAEKGVDAARAQVLAVEASIQAAQASVTPLQEMETYLRVTAPFDGVITARGVHPGALVGPGAGADPMFQLEQDSRLRLVVAVPEVDVGGIARGYHVPFTVPAHPGQTFTGVVARISRSLDPKTRSMAVELDVKNPRRQLAPGMYPTLQWPVRQAKAALVVPVTSVVTTTERTFVVRVKDGTAAWVNVTRGTAHGELVEVMGALQEGDLVVRRASDEIREGMKIAAKASK